MSTCSEHIQLIKEIDKGNANIDVIKEKIIGVDARINGSIDDIKKHIEHGQAWRMSIVGVFIVIIIQIGTFVYLWGGVTEIVKKNTDHLWKTVTPQITENTRNIDKILAKIDVIHSMRTESIGDIKK